MRVGVSGLQWAQEWRSVMAEADLPGSDYIPQAQSLDLLSFTSRIATCGHSVHGAAIALGSLRDASS